MRSSIIFIFVIGILALTGLQNGCGEDPCASVNCQNGGTCLDGSCDCPEGFIGPQCNIKLDPCLQKNCDPARTDTCLVNNDGVPQCFCKRGFEGDLCDQSWSQKFLGTYTQSELCNNNGVNFDVGIEDGPENGQITFVNFNNKLTSNQTAKVVANLIGSNVLEIYEQFMYFGKVTGAGSRATDGKISLNYTIITPGNADTLVCSALLEKK